jgi:hypothetical protein
MEAMEVDSVMRRQQTRQRQRSNAGHEGSALLPRPEAWVVAGNGNQRGPLDRNDDEREDGPGRFSRILAHFLAFFSGLGTSLLWTLMVATSSLFAEQFDQPMCLAWLGLANGVGKIFPWFFWTVFEILADRRTKYGSTTSRFPGLVRPDGTFSTMVTAFGLLGQLGCAAFTSYFLAYDSMNLVLLYSIVFADGVFGTASSSTILRLSGKISPYDEDLFLLANSLVALSPMMLWASMQFMPGMEAVQMLIWGCAGVLFLTTCASGWYLRLGRQLIRRRTQQESSSFDRPGRQISTRTERALGYLPDESDTEDLMSLRTVQGEFTSAGTILDTGGDGLGEPIQTLTPREQNSGCFSGGKFTVFVLIPLLVVVTKVISSAVLGVAAKVHGMGPSMHLVGAYQIAEILGRGGEFSQLECLQSALYTANFKIFFPVHD